MFEYSFIEWLMFFYIYCFIGWIIESTIVSIDQKRFVNRGFLRGPCLPLYGFGAIVILFVSLPFKSNAFLTYIFGMIGATVLEYITAVLMESIFKMKYWDYSNYKFNFQGRICLLSSLFWGFLSLLLTYVIHNPIEKLVLFLNSSQHTLLIIFDVIISILIVADTIYAVRTAFDVNKLLNKMTKIKSEIEVLLDNVSENINEKLEESATVLKAKERIAELREEYSNAINKIGFFRSSLISAHPYARSHKFNEALKDIKQKLIEKKNEYISK